MEVLLELVVFLKRVPSPLYASSLKILEVLFLYVLGIWKIFNL